MSGPPPPAARPAADLQMKWFDRVLRGWRIAKAEGHAQGARVLDIGCADGALFRKIEPAMAEGVGIDSGLAREIRGRNWTVVPGWFPEDLPDDRPFDLITMLAVIEHIPADRQMEFAGEVAGRLNPGGIAVITVPSKAVDPIVHTLMKLRIMRAVGIEQHWGFDHTKVPDLFGTAGLELVERRRFQLGLNNLYVLRRPAEPAS